MHVFLKCLSKNEAEIDVVKTNTELVNAFNLPFGITHAEYIYSEKRHKTYLVEIAARGGGYIFLHILHQELAELIQTYY